MVRKGFTLLELIIVIAIIGILSTLGYKGYSYVTDSSKAANVKDEIDKIKMAIAKAQAFGVQWGGGLAPSDAVPKKDVSENNCNYRSKIEGDTNTSTDECKSENVIQTERVLYDELVKAGFVYSSDGTFRSPSHNAVKIGIIANIKGYSPIRFYGLPGRIAALVYKDLNGDDKLLNTDGSNSKRPVMLATSNTTPSNNEGENPVAIFYGSSGSNSGGYGKFTSMSIVEKTPKVDLLYFFNTTGSSTEWGK